MPPGSSRIGSRFLQKWFKVPPEMVPGSSRNSSGFFPKWHRVLPELAPGSSRSGSGFLRKWLQVPPDVVPGSSGSHTTGCGATRLHMRRQSSPSIVIDLLTNLLHTATSHCESSDFAGLKGLTTRR